MADTETLEIELDEARTVMLETLRDELDEEALQGTLEHNVNQLITELYDRRDELKAQEQQPVQQPVPRQ